MGIYVKENWSQIIIFIAKPKQSKLFRVCMKAVHHSLSYKTFERRGCICLRARGWKGAPTISGAVQVSRRFGDNLTKLTTQLCYGFQVESFWPRNQEMGVDLKPAKEKILGQGDWKMLVSQCTYPTRDSTNLSYYSLASQCALEGIVPYPAWSACALEDK